MGCLLRKPGRLCYLVKSHRPNKLDKYCIVYVCFCFRIPIFPRTSKAGKCLWVSVSEKIKKQKQNTSLAPSLLEEKSIGDSRQPPLPIEREVMSGARYAMMRFGVPPAGRGIVSAAHSKQKYVCSLSVHTIEVCTYNSAMAHFLHDR